MPVASGVVNGPLASAKYTSDPIDTTRCFATLTFDRQKKQSFAMVSSLNRGPYVQLLVFVFCVVSLDNRSLNETHCHRPDMSGPQD